MPIETFSLLTKEVLENTLFVEASQVAELGAIKPREYGCIAKNILKERISTDAVYESLEGRAMDGLSLEGARNSISGVFHHPENGIWQSLRPQDAAKDVAEYLCDNEISPLRWKNAELDERIEMINKAVKIMGEELMLPQKWQEQINPIIALIPPKENGTITKAYVRYEANLLSNGSVEFIGNPEFVVNEYTLHGDFFDAISTMYHEMIHIKQYATVDGVIPTNETSYQILDMIDHIKDHPEFVDSRVGYLSSPFEAEAWAQGLFFKEMLKAVVWEYGSVTL